MLLDCFRLSDLAASRDVMALAFFYYVLKRVFVISQACPSVQMNIDTDA